MNLPNFILQDSISERNDNDSKTFVSCFYDLQKRETGRRDINFYLNNSKLLDKNINLIIYTEASLYDNIFSRLKYPDRVIIKVLELENTYPYYLITNNELKYPITDKDSNPNKDTRLYSCLMACKYFLMMRVLEENPFDSIYFSWIDMGISYVADMTYFDEILNLQPKKFRAVMMNYHKHQICDEYKYYTACHG